MRTIDKSFYYITVIIVVFISFLFYSSNFYPLLSSDDALNILMAHYYKLPNDLYCWGQDRGGTLIPLISQVFIKILNLSAITSVSISNYLIIIIGFIGFSSLFKTRYSKILFALVWFLPFQRFIELLRYPIGVEYSLIALAILLINRLEEKISLSNIRYNLLLVGISLVLITSVWVSDLAIVNICVLLFTLLIFKVYRSKQKINFLVIAYFVLGSIACIVSIRYVKTFAVDKFENYLSINNLEGIKAGFLILGKSFYDVLVFNTNEIFVSIYSYLIVVFLVSFVIYLSKKKLLALFLRNIWLTFFLLDFIVIFAACILSYWVLANDMGRWYFVASYISLSLVIILAIEQLSTLGYRLKFFKWFLIIIAIIGAVSPVYTMRYVDPKTLKPRVELAGEFTQLGKIGIIAEFWNAYIISCSDPDMIKATTHDQCFNRNQNFIDSVFEQKNLYIIKDMWLNDFPDTLEQYGYVFQKDGSQFRMGGCDVCKYTKVKLNKFYSLSKLRHNSPIVFDSSIGRKVLFVSSKFDSCKERHFVFGPYISIGKGEFTARFYMRANNFTSDNSIALFDIIADEKGSQLASKLISKTNCLKDGYNYVDLDFESFKRHKNVEFRIYYYGNADLYFDHVELIEK